MDPSRQFKVKSHMRVAEEIHPVLRTIVKHWFLVLGLTGATPVRAYVICLCYQS
jgi:hypothetical protein